MYFIFISAIYERASNESTKIITISPLWTTIPIHVPYLLRCHMRFQCWTTYTMLFNGEHVFGKRTNCVDASVHWCMGFRLLKCFTTTDKPIYISPIPSGAFQDSGKQINNVELLPDSEMFWILLPCSHHKRTFLGEKKPAQMPVFRFFKCFTHYTNTHNSIISQQ